LLSVAKLISFLVHMFLLISYEIFLILSYSFWTLVECKCIVATDVCVSELFALFSWSLWALRLAERLGMTVLIWRSLVW
jgi:hypothetical protein